MNVEDLARHDYYIRADAEQEYQRLTAGLCAFLGHDPATTVRISLSASQATVWTIEDTP